MKIVITILLYPICWYLSFALFIHYDKYQFIWSDNGWIEAAQRMLWLLWPMAGIALVLMPIIMMVVRHPAVDDYQLKIDKLIDEMEKDLEP